MPFKSEAQRRYLWANEPEIARDWTDTYGSKIHAADGGIMRLGFDNGGEVVDDLGHAYETSRYGNEYDPEYITEEEFNEMFGEETIGIGERITSGIDTLKDKFTGGAKYMKNLPGMAISALTGIPGLGLAMQALQGPQLTPQQKQMNTNFMNQYNVTRNPITGRMVGGPFAGMNAPGMSALGSKTPQQMAQKWLNKYGHTAPQERVHEISALAGKDTPTPAQMGGSNNGGGYNVPARPSKAPSRPSRNIGGHSGSGYQGASGSHHYNYRRGGIASL